MDNYAIHCPVNIRTNVEIQCHIHNSHTVRQQEENQCSMSADVQSHDVDIPKLGEAKAARGSVQLCSCNQNILSCEGLIGP